MAQRILPPQRTQGDGMEKTETDTKVENVSKKNSLGNVSDGNVQNICSDKNIKEKCKDSTLTSEQLIYLQPHNVVKPNKKFLSNFNAKEPKFVPYEPYKAAVKPIVPIKKKHSGKLTKKIHNAKNILHALDSSDKKETTYVCETETKDVLDDSLLCKCEKTIEAAKKWGEERKMLQSNIQTLKEENEQLENQLKFQVQVNGELKNLLVAAVGEDMETRVHVLTEDKLHLARALLNSAKSLSTHQEQTEWLAGQCEVWRSKFLASSVMVEELARWKAALSQKVNEAQELIKKLLEEHKRVREHIVKTFNNLSFLQDNFDLVNKRPALKSTNILDVSALVSKISDVLILQLLGCQAKTKYDLGCFNEWTPAEKQAEHMVANPHSLHLIGDPDAACNAVVGAAVALSGQLFLRSHPPNIACCAQCSGEIKLV